MTRATEMSKVRSTSRSEARIVGVRSMTTVRSMARGISARRCGNSARIRSTVSMILAPGWRRIISSTEGLPLAKPALRRSSTESFTSARSARRTALPL